MTGQPDRLAIPHAITQEGNMDCHEAKRRIDEALRLVSSVRSKTGNPALRGSLRLPSASLTKYPARWYTSRSAKTTSRP